MKNRKKAFGNSVLAGLLALTVSAPLGAADSKPPSAEEMWRIIQEQQKTIEELKAKLETTQSKVTATEEKVVATDKKVEETAERVEEAASAVSTAASWAERTKIGGYGELHYNNLTNDETGSDTEEVDFHRFVLYLAHEFSDRVRFYSELEVEHALVGESEPGEVELEQAWIELSLTENHNLRAGLDLIPVGIINPTHEPPTFYGVERNPIETNIIPTTWWEAGIGLNGQIAPGWNYDIVGHSGLDVSTTSFTIRGGRNKVAEAPAENGAVTGRVRYTRIPGLEVGVTGQYQSDITQGDMDIDATLFEGHVAFLRNGFGLRALAARWDLDDGPVGIGPEALDRDVQWGWYIEPSYRFSLARLTAVPGELGVFARYNRWDNGGAGDTEEEQFNAGFNYWPVENVVFKFDWQEQLGERAGNDNDGFNLGVGYQFF